MRPGLAHCCPLTYIPCPTLSPLTAQSRAGQTLQSLFESNHYWPSVGVENSSRTRLESARAGRGSLPSIQATFAQHMPHGAKGGESGVYCWPQGQAPTWTLGPLLTCSKSGYRRHTQTQSLSGLQGLKRRKNLVRRFLVPSGSWPQTLEPPPHSPKPHTDHPSPSLQARCPSSPACPQRILFPWELGALGVTIPTAGLTQMFYALEIILAPKEYL